MDETVDEALARRVIDAVPEVKATERPERRFGAALESLIRHEEWRRGAPEAFTGALMPDALMQGTLLKREFDLSVHAHTGWEVGAVIVDVKGLILVNQDAGFASGDRVLLETAAALRAALPRGLMVRMHGDCYAVLFLPSSGEVIRDEHLVQVTEALARVPPAVEATQKFPFSQPLGFTISALRLRIFDPAHWQVLGPLVVSELERAHAMTRRGLASGIQERELRLDGRVP